MAIAVIMLVPSVSSQSDRSSSSSGLSSASSSSPYVTEESAAANQSSLTLSSPGALNIFALATGGDRRTTGFESGNLVNARDQQGLIAAAVAVTQSASDNYTTIDHYYSIAGVGVGGFLFYGERTKVLIPPVQPTSTLTELLKLPESAFVVVVALSGGQTSIVLNGLPGLTLDVNATGGTWSGIQIGQAQLAASSYTVTVTTTDHNAGGTNQADLLGIFAFSYGQAGFIDKPAPPTVTATSSSTKAGYAVNYTNGNSVFVTPGGGVGGSWNEPIVNCAAKYVGSSMTIFTGYGGFAGTPLVAEVGVTAVCTAVNTATYTAWYSFGSVVNTSVVVTNKSTILAADISYNPNSQLYNVGLVIKNGGYFSATHQGALVNASAEVFVSVPAKTPLAKFSPVSFYNFDVGNGSIGRYPLTKVTMWDGSKEMAYPTAIGSGGMSFDIKWAKYGP
ncbi:MAG: hypothetical protein WB789_03000 [Thermoplasmata archaeon]